MKNTTFIYGLIDPRDGQIKYIGKTINPKRRLLEHLVEKSPTKKNNWVQKLRKLDLKPELVIIDEIIDNESVFWEQYWICQFKVWGFKLLNGTDGGDNPPKRFGKENSFHIPEVKKKIDEMNRARRGKTFEELYGNKRAKEIKENASQKFSGAGNPNYRGEILQLDLNGNLIKIWSDSKIAAKALNIDASGITRCINGEYKKCSGFIWKRKS